MPVVGMHALLYTPEAEAVRAPSTVAELRAKGAEFRGEPTDDDFGVWITMLLPGDLALLLYEPKHATPLDV